VRASHAITLNSSPKDQPTVGSTHVGQRGRRATEPRVDRDRCSPKQLKGREPPYEASESLSSQVGLTVCVSAASGKERLGNREGRFATSRNQNRPDPAGRLHALVRRRLAQASSFDLAGTFGCLGLGSGAATPDLRVHDQTWAPPLGDVLYLHLRHNRPYSK
jgi:hypothetical protein